MSLEKARVARDEALIAVDQHASQAFKDAAFSALEHAAREHEYLIVDRVWEYMGDNAPTTHEKRVMGAIMRLGHRDALIEPTDTFEPSAQTQCHANPRRIWKSLVYTA